MEQVISIALGGAVGALLRVYGGAWIMRLCPGSLPYGTMAVNLLGAFLIGLLSGLLTSRSDWPIWVRYLLISGGLGAFTTFSTLALEWLELLMAGEYGGAIFYGGIQLVGGLVLVGLGLWLARVCIACA